VCDEPGSRMGGKTCVCMKYARGVLGEEKVCSQKKRAQCWVLPKCLVAGSRWGWCGRTSGPELFVLMLCYPHDMARLGLPQQALSSTSVKIHAVQRLGVFAQLSSLLPGNCYRTKYAFGSASTSSSDRPSAPGETRPCAVIIHSPESKYFLRPGCRQEEGGGQL